MLDATMETMTDGGSLRFMLTVRNDGVKPVPLRFRSGQRAEFIVDDPADGDTVWRYGADRMFTQALGTETLVPGDSTTYEAVWPDPPSGTYRVVGEVTATEHDVGSETTVTVK